MVTRIVLLPGLDGSTALFRPFLSCTALDATAVCYPTGPANRYADLLPVVRDALPDDEDFVLLGWSFSGPLALMAAAEPPPRLRGVILCATFVVKPVFYLPAAVRHLARPSLFRFSARALRLKALLGGYGTAELDALLREAHGGVPPAVMAMRVRETLTVDVRDALRACPVPLLYLRASRDRVVPAWNLRRIHEVRPDVVEAVVEGPHLALATNPGLAAQAIERFAAEV